MPRVPDVPGDVFNGCFMTNNSVNRATLGLIIKTNRVAGRGKGRPILFIRFLSSLNRWRRSDEFYVPLDAAAAAAAPSGVVLTIRSDPRRCVTIKRDRARSRARMCRRLIALAINFFFFRFNFNFIREIICFQYGRKTDTNDEPTAERSARVSSTQISLATRNIPVRMERRIETFFCFSFCFQFFFFFCSKQLCLMNKRFFLCRKSIELQYFYRLIRDLCWILLIAKRAGHC